jgi:hypothetical protein
MNMGAEYFQLKYLKLQCNSNFNKIYLLKADTTNRRKRLNRMSGDPQFTLVKKMFNTLK